DARRSSRCRPSRGWGPAGRGASLSKSVRPDGRSRPTHGEAGGARGGLAGEVGEDAIDWHGAEVVPSAVAEAHGAVLGLARADHQHVRHLANLRVADPVGELLVAGVEPDAVPPGPQ